MTAPARKRIPGWLGVVLVVLLVAAFLGWLGWCIFTVISESMRRPAMIPVIAIVVVGFVLFLWRQRRIELAEVKRFAQRPQANDEVFLHEIDLAPGTPAAGIALRARAVFASLGSIEPSSIHAPDRFYPDFEKLPFYDSMDIMEIILRLEESLEIALDNKDSGRILDKIAEKRSATVGEVVLEVVDIWKAKQNANPNGVS